MIIKILKDWLASRPRSKPVTTAKPVIFKAGDICSIGRDGRVRNLTADAQALLAEMSRVTLSKDGYIVKAEKPKITRRVVPCACNYDAATDRGCAHCPHVKSRKN